RIMEAFAEVSHARDNLPSFKLKVEPSDRPEVQWVQGGFFNFSLLGRKTLKVLVDPESIFGSDTSFQEPLAFKARQSWAALPQRTEAQFACACSYTPLTIRPRQMEMLVSYYGQADSWEEAAAFRKRVQTLTTYPEAKREENASILSGITDDF